MLTSQGGAVDAPQQRNDNAHKDSEECAELLDWSRSGWLDKPEITRLSRLLNRPVTIRSCLPSAEDEGFPNWALVPSKFLADVLGRAKAAGFSAVPWLIGPRATTVLCGAVEGGADEAVVCEELTEFDPMRDDAVDAARQPRGELQLQQTRIRVVVTTPCPRDALGDLRDMVLQAIRGAAPAAGGEDVADHMLAGAYLRQMMVIDEDGEKYDEGMRTAIFTFASFDEQPEVFTMEFQASPLGIERSRAVTGTLTALIDHDRIRVDPHTIKWLRAHGDTLLAPERAEWSNTGDGSVFPAATPAGGETTTATATTAVTLTPPLSRRSLSPPDQLLDEIDVWAELEGRVEPPTVLFCRRAADAEPNGKDRTIMAQLSALALGITACFAACLGFRKGRVVEDCELTPRARSMPPPPPPPLLVHEI